MPMKAILKGSDVFTVLATEQTLVRYIFKTHQFSDVTKPLQQFAQPIITEYFNLAQVEYSSSKVKDDDTYLFQGMLIRSEEKQI